MAVRLSAFATVALLVFLPNAQCQITAVATTVYNFIGNGTDGVHPRAGLVQGTDGNFYGTTASGGGSGYGTVFRFTPSGVFTTLHSFSNGADGADPEAGLIQGSDGNFYGTTASGGSNYYFGTVFQITPAGVLTTLHSFSETGTDGANPAAGLVQGLDGKFYGTTHNGGTGNDGTVYSITSEGEYASLYSFSGSGMDGKYPEAGLFQASDGSFYGTTANGGSGGEGTVFQITSAGEYTTLHSFTGIGLDGLNPYAGLIQGSDGNFYGTTPSGGGSGGGEGAGTVFQITSTGSYHPVYSFNGTGGAASFSALIQGSDGNLYGTTEYGGSGNTGTAFQVTPTGLHTVLHSFTNTGTDGGYPNTKLIQGSDGSIYGTTPGGGNNGQGTIFKLTFVPRIDLAIAGSDMIVEGGAPGILIVTRTGDSSAALTIYYSVKGTAAVGVDYKKLSGSVTISAGAAQAKIKVKPLSNSPNTGTLKIKMVLVAPSDGSYTVGNSTAKIKLIGK